MQRFNVPATSRASFGMYNTIEEVDILVHGLKKILEVFWIMEQELRELYQQVILDHNKSPRNFRLIEHPSNHAEGYNPLCGDKINIFLNVNDEANN